jgi:hypothetical protein
MGKILMAFAVAGVLSGSLADHAAAAPAPSRPDVGAPSNIIEAAVHCGPKARYIRGHRDAHGRYIRGRCVRIHR